MADVRVGVQWLGTDLTFAAGAAGGPAVVMDGNGRAGPTPVQLLIASIAGCSAVDVVDILGKMRVPLESLEVVVEADRVADPPRRLSRVRLVYQTRGVPAGDEQKLRRAVALSHEKYCSVLHTLRPEVEVESEIVLG